MWNAKITGCFQHQKGSQQKGLQHQESLQQQTDDSKIVQKNNFDRILLSPSPYSNYPNYPNYPYPNYPYPNYPYPAPIPLPADPNPVSSGACKDGHIWVRNLYPNYMSSDYFLDWDTESNGSAPYQMEVHRMSEKDINNLEQLVKTETLNDAAPGSIDILSINLFGKSTIHAHAPLQISKQMRDTLRSTGSIVVPVDVGVDPSYSSSYYYRRPDGKNQRQYIPHSHYIVIECRSTPMTFLPKPSDFYDNFVYV